MFSIGVASPPGEPRGVDRPRVGAFAASVVSACLLWSPLAGSAPLPLKALLLLIASLAAAAPSQGLLVVSGLFPIAGVLGTVLHVTWRGSDVGRSLIAAFLLGWFVHLVRTRTRAAASTPVFPVLAAAMVVCASAVVSTLKTAALEGSLRGVGDGLRSILTGDYINLPAGFEPVYAALDILFALALFSAVRWITRQPDGIGTRQVVRMLALGVTAAAALNVVRLIQISISAPHPLMTARWYLQWLRINVQYADMNAAGSVFGMVLLIAIGLLRSATRWRSALWIGTVAVLAAALWLAGSRSAIAAVLLSGGAAAFVDARARLRGRIGHLARVGAMLVFAAVAVFMLVRFPRTFANADPSIAVASRMEMLERGFRMLRDHPVFGVGTGRFLGESGRYATPGSFGQENAHNSYLQILAELGLTGFIAFAWIFVAAASDLWRAFQTNPWLRWMAAGTASYLLTAFSGHPLIVFEAAIPFWIVLGATPGSLQTARRPRAARIAFVAFAAFLLITLPFRLNASVRLLMHSQPTVTWYKDGDVRYRDVGAEDTILISRPASHIAVPLRLRAAGAAEALVDISVDDQPINQVVVTSARWSDVRILFPKRAGYQDRRVTLRLRVSDPAARLLVGRVKLP